MKKILDDAEKLMIRSALNDERIKVEGWFKTAKNPANRADHEVRLNRVVGLLDELTLESKVTVEN